MLIQEFSNSVSAALGMDTANNRRKILRRLKIKFTNCTLLPIIIFFPFHKTKIPVKGTTKYCPLRSNPRVTFTA